jgi:uncharacterized protein
MTSQSRPLVLVTGASAGIGAAFARAYAARGHDLALVARRADRLEALAAELSAAHGVEAFALPADLSVLDAQTPILAALDARGRHVDVLVNNAGFGIAQSFTGVPWSRQRDFLMTLVVNACGLAYGVIPGMVARGGGAIVNVASIAGQRISFGGTANYSASKAGLLGLTRHAAYELAPDGIRVNAVCPGPTATAFGGAIPSQETKALRAQKIPLGRMCEPEDIADPILFLAGHAARMITGVALTVDGGVLIKNDTPYEEYFRPR